MLRWLASEAETLVLEFQDQRYAVRTCAPGPGRVEQILVQLGEQVSRGQELLIFWPLNPAG